MPKQLLDTLKLNIGRLIGQSKRKDKDVVQLWQDMLRANNINPTDRLIELMAYDLQSGGAKLADYKTQKKIEEVQEAFSMADLATEMGTKIASITKQAMDREIQHANEVAQLTNQINQLQIEISKMQKMFQEAQTQGQ